MNRKLKTENGISGMFFMSLLLHITLFGIIYRFTTLIPHHLPEVQTYYVDVVNLPVAKPQAGAPSPAEKAPSPEPSPAPKEMHLPPPVTKKPVESSRPLKKETTPLKKEAKPVQEKESSEDFAKRLADMEKAAGERQLSQKMKTLQEKNAGRAGIQGGKGNQVGSDYAGYVRSRLKDAFSSTINYQSRNPKVVVNLRINRFGRLVGYRVEQTSNDKLFETAVTRAIDMAVETLPPPPDGRDFEHGYVFRPEGVGKK